MIILRLLTCIFFTSLTANEDFEVIQIKMGNSSGILGRFKNMTEWFKKMTKRLYRFFSFKRIMYFPESKYFDGTNVYENLEIEIDDYNQTYVVRGYLPFDKKERRTITIGSTLDKWCLRRILKKAKKGHVSNLSSNGLFLILFIFYFVVALEFSMPFIAILNPISFFADISIFLIFMLFSILFSLPILYAIESISYFLDIPFIQVSHITGEMHQNEYRRGRETGYYYGRKRFY